MNEINKPIVVPNLPTNYLSNAVYAANNIEKDGEAGLSKKEISLYIQETYGVDAETADKIADYALRKAGGEINNGGQLANALGLDTLEKTTSEKLQDLHADLTGGKPSKDTQRIDLLAILVNAAATLPPRDDRPLIPPATL